MIYSSFMRQLLKKKYKELKALFKNIALDLSISQQNHLADLLKDTANYVLVTLVISQFLESGFKPQILLFGCILFSVLLIFSTRLAKKESDD